MDLKKPLVLEFYSKQVKMPSIALARRCNNY